MAVLSAVVILGIRMPLSELLTSSIADASGVVPSGLMAICALCVPFAIVLPLFYKLYFCRLSLE